MSTVPAQYIRQQSNPPAVASEVPLRSMTWVDRIKFALDEKRFGRNRAIIRAKIRLISRQFKNLELDLLGELNTLRLTGVRIIGDNDLDTSLPEISEAKAQELRSMFDREDWDSCATQRPVETHA